MCLYVVVKVRMQGADLRRALPGGSAPLGGSRLHQTMTASDGVGCGQFLMVTEEHESPRVACDIYDRGAFFGGRGPRIPALAGLLASCVVRAEYPIAEVAESAQQQRVLDLLREHQLQA